jgi:hypothetical protein
MIALEGVRDALATRLATASGIPATRYDGTASVSPAPSVAYVEADFVPSGTERVTLALTGADVKRDGLYVVRWFSATGDSDTLDDAADAVLAVFPTNLTLTTANGETVRVKTRPVARTDRTVACRTIGRDDHGPVVDADRRLTSLPLTSFSRT